MQTAHSMEVKVPRFVKDKEVIEFYLLGHESLD